MRVHSPAHVVLILCIVGAALTFAITFVLTEQTPEETTVLSRGVEERVVSTAAAGDSSDGAGSFEGQEAGVVEVLLAIADIRAWAHVPEFFLQGFFLFGAVALWPHAVRTGSEEISRKRRYGIALLACAACSLFDQVHKAFVPGREFDARDLLFDAIGYLLAMAVVLAISAAVHAVGRSRSRTGGRD